MKKLDLLVSVVILGVAASALLPISGAPLAVSSWQEPQKPAKPDRQLPDPNPQPAPNPAQQNGQKPDNPQQPTAQQSGPSTQAQPQQGTDQRSRSFTGKIVQKDGRYILKGKSAKTTYMLDDQDKARQFKGQQVTVTGVLDAASNTIHVTEIQPDKS